jgi:hypothetical protein
MIHGFAGDELPLVKTITIIEQYLDVGYHYILAKIINGIIEFRVDLLQDLQDSRPFLFRKVQREEGGIKKA